MSPTDPSSPSHEHSAALRECQAQLAQQQQELSSLLYAVSHDLRAPLRAISGFGQALREHAAGMLDETGLHYLQRIEDSSRRMGTLLEALLSLSRLSQSELMRLNVDVTQLAHEAVALVAAEYPSHRPAVIVAPGMRAHADPRLLKQALQRLLDNAWKCTLARGEPRIEIGCIQHEAQAAYFVRDNGVGFDMSYARKLFVPFQQLHARTELNGLGVGLATVQRIVALHGGRAWAEAQTDAGAQFFFTLPAASDST